MRKHFSCLFQSIKKYSGYIYKEVCRPLSNSDCFFVIILYCVFFPKITYIFHLFIKQIKKKRILPVLIYETIRKPDRRRIKKQYFLKRIFWKKKNRDFLVFFSFFWSKNYKRKRILKNIKNHAVPYFFKRVYFW